MKKGIVFGVPRSGTSWVGAVLGSHPTMRYRFQPLHSYSFAPKISETSSKNEVDAFFAELWHSADPYVNRQSLASQTENLETLSAGSSEAFLLFKEVHDFDAIENAIAVNPEVKLIGLVRNPIDVISSWVNAPREWNPEWDLLSEWKEAKLKNSEYEGNHFGVAQWILTTKRMCELERKMPDSCRTVTYEQTVSDPKTSFESLQKFMGLAPAEEIERAIEKTRSFSINDSYSIFRKTGRRARPKPLPSPIIESVVRLVKEHDLERFLRVPAG